ncbi:MAG: hypothetical protein BGO95_02595 [Micrococcales bacterium 73-13]|nr:MAG: hypothetical protein BGO95_02595 [Micrococcales bacterium 73-13]
MPAAVSIGLAGGVPVQAIVETATAAERAGLRALWLNETPGVDALAGLAAAAATERLLLGVGVVPLDRFPADVLAARVERAGIPPERLLLGVGSGRAPHAAALVERGVRGLRDRVGSPILVGGLGPLVRRVGAELADGLLLNWLPPDAAAAAADDARRQAAAAGRPRPHVALYARTAIDPAAHPALRAEAERYAAFPGYAANFARIGRGPLDGSILAADAAGLRAGVAAYAAAVDELVLRAITANGTPAEIGRLVDAVAATA